MKWTQIKISTARENLDTLCAVMSMLDPGLMIEDYSDVMDRVNPLYGEIIDEEILKKDPERIAVSIFVPEEKNLAEYVSFLDERLTSLGINHQREFIGADELDWENAWKQYYKPLHIGKNIVIVPLWEKYDAKAEDIIVRMDPGMAFGTGTHETTSLCLEMLEKHISPICSVLDIGTGSGILAICAAKLGASRVFSCDIDPVSVRVANNNISINGVEDKIICKQSDLLSNADNPCGGYDLICANIVADILLRMSADVGGFIAKDGIIILSGIIENQFDEVYNAYTSAAFEKVDEKRDNGWCALVLKKIDKS